MSTLTGRLFDATEALRATDPYDDYRVEDVVELIDAADDMVNAHSREKIADALRDVNGLQPTPFAMDVIMAVVDQIREVDKSFGANNFSGLPESYEYAEAIVDALARRYLV